MFDKLNFFYIWIVKSLCNKELLEFLKQKGAKEIRISDSSGAISTGNQNSKQNKKKQCVISWYFEINSSSKFTIAIILKDFLKIFMNINEGSLALIPSF